MAHPAVYLTAEPGHGGGIGHAVADDESSIARGGGGEKGGDILGGVLAVAVEAESPDEFAFEGSVPAGVEGGAFAAAGGMVEDLGAGGGGLGGGGVGGGVVDDEDVGQELADAADDRGDGGGFVVAGNDCSAVVRPVHGAEGRGKPCGRE